MYNYSTINAGFFKSILYNNEFDEKYSYNDVRNSFIILNIGSGQKYNHFPCSNLLKLIIDHGEYLNCTIFAYVYPISYEKSFPNMVYKKFIPEYIQQYEGKTVITQLLS